jgi:two-component system, cell cycle response regulator DivK
MSKLILVVEDQEDNRQIIRDMLSATDYEIMEAENGEQALSAVAKQRPDLILMDIQLPIIDGYEATRRIKADPGLKSIPIIAVTSYALSGEEAKARAAGCDDYVPKPYSPRHYWQKFAVSALGLPIDCSAHLVESEPYLAAFVTSISGWISRQSERLLAFDQ